MEPNDTKIDLPVSVQQWIKEKIGADAEIISAQLMKGSTSSTLHRIIIQAHGQKVRLVLRRYTNLEWLADEPDLALHEATNLKTVSLANLPTPVLVDFDSDGSVCDVPAILMTELPGFVDLAPSDFNDWLHRQAEALVPIHTIALQEYPWHYAPYNNIHQLEIPDWSQEPQLWEKALDIIRGPIPAHRESFIHRDYHPVNVLWQNDRITGIVDWVNACLGPSAIDVAWCRANLAIMYGTSVADQFLKYYQSLAGTIFDYHPFWDLMVIIEILPGPPSIYPPWITFGIHDLNEAKIIDRNDNYLKSVMSRL
jgi:aminoglycoside phosphotransferase (APT) family kinase protein